MTEQEARKIFRSLAKPAEGSPVPTICMYEAEAIDFAKAYAASQVAACYKGIVTQRELKLILAAYKAKNASIDEVTQVIMDVVYSKVAAKDAEIAALKDANGRLKTHLSIAGAAHFAETSALKADNVRKLELQDTMHQNAEAALKEEIKQLREGVNGMMAHTEQCEGVTNIQTIKSRIKWIDKLGKEALLSPKDVTENKENDGI